MKILKIRVRSDSQGNMIYPIGYLSINAKEHLYCPDVENDILWLLVLVEDIDAEIIIKSEDVHEITLAEAEIIASKYDKKKTKITDEGIIRIIEIKSRIGKKLTKEEECAIDPENEQPGINYKDTFIDLVKRRMKIK